VTEHPCHDLGREPVAALLGVLQWSDTLRVWATRFGTSRDKQRGDVHVKLVACLGGGVDLEFNGVVQRRPPVPVFVDVCTHVKQPANSFNVGVFYRCEEVISHALPFNRTASGDGSCGSPSSPKECPVIRRLGVP
jgi:hypothetical protein